MRTNAQVYKPISEIVYIAFVAFSSARKVGIGREEQGEEKAVSEVEREGCARVSRMCYCEGEG